MLSHFSGEFVQELSVEEFLEETQKSIDWVCLYTGADRRTVFRHKKNPRNDKPQYVQFRRHLALLAKTINK